MWTRLRGRLRRVAGGRGGGASEERDGDVGAEPLELEPEALGGDAALVAGMRLEGRAPRSR